MSLPSLPSFRRLFTLLVPLVALVVLVVIGRSVTSAAPPLTSASVPAGADAHAGASAASALPVASAASPLRDAGSDAATDAPRFATETLGDGAVLVDLNLASEDDLRKLPGIGATRARAILALRGRLGRFKSVDELARIKGLGRNMIKRLRPLVRVSAP